jgi:hypothetical protein
MFVYHFTDTVRLPWIVLEGELQPSKNRIRGFPQDFLWATTSEKGDRTSSAMFAETQRAHRDGVVQMVRFTLDAAEFEDWRTAVSRSQEWNPQHIAALEMVAASRRVDPRCWRCRREPLALSRAISVHVKSWQSSKWSPIDFSMRYSATASAFSEAGELMNCFVIDGYGYCSTKRTTPDGIRAYDNICRIPIRRSGIAAG